MTKFTIGNLKAVGIPSDETIRGMFYDWFCSDSSLARRGRTCIARLASLVKSAPDKFNDEDTIDIKNNCPCSGPTYDCIRVWDKGEKFKYAFVPKENGGGCSYLIDGGDIIDFKNWHQLKKSFANI